MAAVTIKKARKLAKRARGAQLIASIPKLREKAAKAEAEYEAIRAQTEGNEDSSALTVAQLRDAEAKLNLAYAEMHAARKQKRQLEPVPAGTMMRTSNGREYRILADGSRVREQPMKIKAI